MLRCAFVALMSCALALPAAAQQLRNFSASVLRGELVVGQPPEATLNGRPARLAPGARIRGESNMLQMPATLSGQRLVVNYTLDLSGMLLDVWILTPQERERKPWPTTEKEARAWEFNVDAQTWTRR